MTRCYWEILRRPKAILLVMTGIQSALSLAFGLLSARWMGPTNRGAVVLMITTASLAMWLLPLGTATGGRLLLATRRPDYGPRDHMLLAVITLFSSLIVVAPLSHAILHFLEISNSVQIAALFTLYTALVASSYSLREGVHGINRHSRAVIGDVLTWSIMVSGAIALYRLSLLTTSWVLALMTISISAQWFIQASTLFRSEDHRRSGSSRIAWQAVLALSAPAVAGVVSQAIVIRGDRILLGIQTNTGEVGLYSAGATFGEVLWLVPLALSQMVFAASAQGRRDIVKRLKVQAMLLSILAGLALSVAAPFAIPWILGDEYAAAVPITWLLIIGAIAMGASILNTADLNGAGAFAVASRIQLLGAIIICLTTYFAAPEFGMYAAAGASVAAYTIMGFLSKRHVMQLEERKKVRSVA